MRRWLPIIAIAMSSIAMVLSVALFLQFKSDQDQRDREATARRSDTCRVFETQHLQEVVQLRQTYRFLKHKPRPYARGSLEQFAYKELSRLEKEAKNDGDKFGALVPKYCDEPGFGLPEPDPKVPKRPRALPSGVSAVLNFAGPVLVALINNERTH